MMSRCFWFPWVGAFILLEISLMWFCIIQWRNRSKEQLLYMSIQSQRASLPQRMQEKATPMGTATTFSVFHSDRTAKPLTKKRPRFLWGIMTTLEGSKEKSRRDIIRRTYLGYYKNYPHLADRICSLSEAKAKESCQLIYTFVVGANSNGPTNLVDHKNSSHALTLDESEVVTQFPAFSNSSDASHNIEKDMTFLNIKENMEEGKTPTWFLFANTLVEDYEIDYIAKIDSDTILFPDRFLQFADEILPPSPYNQRVYGGIPMDSLTCGGFRKPHCSEMVGTTYMSGGLYFMSPDLSEFISSPELDRGAIYLEPEDMNTGQCVHSHPQPIFEAMVYERHGLWEHPIKDLWAFEKRWEEYLLLPKCGSEDLFWY